MLAPKRAFRPLSRFFSLDLSGRAAFGAEETARSFFRAARYLNCLDKAKGQANERYQTTGINGCPNSELDGVSAERADHELEHSAPPFPYAF